MGHPSVIEDFPALALKKQFFRCSTFFLIQKQSMVLVDFENPHDEFHILFLFHESYTNNLVD